MAGRPAQENGSDPFGMPAGTVARIFASAEEGVCWSTTGRSLDVNVVAWLPSHGVMRHVNGEVDVLLVGLRGRGILAVAERSARVGPGSVHLIPRDSERSVRAETRLVYLTCHPRRGRLFLPGDLVAQPSRTR